MPQLIRGKAEITRSADNIASSTLGHCSYDTCHRPTSPRGTVQQMQFRPPGVLSKGTLAPMSRCQGLVHAPSPGTSCAQKCPTSPHSQWLTDAGVQNTSPIHHLHHKTHPRSCFWEPHSETDRQALSGARWQDSGLQSK